MNARRRTGNATPSRTAQARQLLSAIGGPEGLARDTGPEGPRPRPEARRWTAPGGYAGCQRGTAGTEL